MDARAKRGVIAMLPSILQPPPDHSEDIKQIICILAAMCRLPPPPDADIRYRLFGEDVTTYEGRDIFPMFASNRYLFYQVTGETPETLIQLEAVISLNVDREHKLSSRNRVVLFMLWLRSYPTYNMLAIICDLSVSTIKDEIKCLVPVFSDKRESYIRWPSLVEWRSMRGTWNKLPDADGTSHEIYRPESEPQEQYYSGYRSYHAIHTQVIVDAFGNIQYVESGFLGHQNDAEQYTLMSQIGTDLPFPGNCILLADKIYPNGDPLMTPYTAAQLARKEGNIRRKCVKLNRLIQMYRIRVEHAIGELKKYKITGSLWRHPRNLLTSIVKICAAHGCRRKQLELNL